MITVQKLALAIQKRFGGTEAEALAESRTVMSYFGFRSGIIDNAIHPDDRKGFYALPDAGLPQRFWGTVPLLRGRNGGTRGPGDDSGGRHGSGISGAPAVAMTTSYGARSGYPRLPSPTTTVTSESPARARFDRAHSASRGIRSIDTTC